MESLLSLDRVVLQSRRSDIGEQRAAWRALLQLAQCTPLQLRDHLKTNLKSLKFSKKDRLEVLQSIGIVPEEETFWQTLQEVWIDYLEARKFENNFFLSTERDSSLCSLR